MNDDKEKCNKCRCWKELTDFIKKDKVMKTCITCRNNGKKWHDKNPTYSQQYNQEHKQKIQIYFKKYREDNKEEISEKKKQYYKDKQEKTKVSVLPS